MIEPPKLVAIREAHQEDLTEDASNMIWSLMGTAMHTVLERAGIISGKGSTEQRLYMTIDDWVVSGQFDYLDSEGVLWDWKFVSVYEYINGIKDSREKQLNVYASLAAANGMVIRGLRVGFIFRDWSQRAAAAGGFYPASQAIQQDIPLWDSGKTDEYIRERIRLHKAARQDPQSISCTEEERCSHT